MKYFDQITEPMQREEKEYFLNTLLLPIFTRYDLKFKLVGGMRRVKEGTPSSHHDIDVLVTLNDSKAAESGRPPFIPTQYQEFILQVLRTQDHILKELSGGISSLSGVSAKMPSKKHVTSLLLMKNQKGRARRIDLVVVPPEHWPFAVLGWSGSTEMEKSWKHYTKHIYEGLANEVDDYGRTRKYDKGRVRWYLSNSRLCFVAKEDGKPVLDKNVSFERLDNDGNSIYTTERDILRGLGLPWLEPWQRCA